MANGKQPPIYFTEEGLRALREELEYLRTEGREQVARRIGEAKADGDISENAGYDEAKNQQAFLEGRILELEQRLKRAVLIQNHDTPADRVDLGRSVTIREVGFDDEETYFIVGSAEANPANGRISNESPMGRSLMGKGIGARVLVDTPGGELEFEIVQIA
ncbi:MAG TPA: transcription elongation factor GreA [Anaerolineae bacterium]|nr:transcription elongation factor GreA [Anaerolineae bacterium]HNU05412.1 transcription elongation factor GreA [Anaerolineae bacterium]